MRLQINEQIQNTSGEILKLRVSRVLQLEGRQKRPFLLSCLIAFCSCLAWLPSSRPLLACLSISVVLDECRSQVAWWIAWVCVCVCVLCVCVSVGKRNAISLSWFWQLMKPHSEHDYVYAGEAQPQKRIWLDLRTFCCFYKNIMVILILVSPLRLRLGTMWTICKIKGADPCPL